MSTAEMRQTSDSGSDQGKGALPSSGKAKPLGIVSKINRLINGTIEKAFNKLGRFIGRRPWLTIVIAVLIALALASGIVQLENEERGDKLWVPKDTVSEKHGDLVDEIYPDFGRFQSFRVQRQDKGSVLNPAAFNRALEVHLRGQSVVWETTDTKLLPPLTNRTKIEYTHVCQGRDGERLLKPDAALDIQLDPSRCSQSNILAVFGYNPDNWATEAAILATINNPASWNRSIVGGGFVIEDALGRLTFDGSNVASAETLSFTFFLAGNQALEDAQKDDVPVEGWEEEWLDAMEEEDNVSDEYNIGRFAARSFDDEFGSTIDGDLVLLQGAIAAIVVFTIFAISVCRDGCVGLRVLLSVGGIINIGLAVVASYGFGSYIGLLFSPLMSILPFIMIGIGVDGMFVLQAALDKTDVNAPMEDRMGYTLSHAGVSVTVASITNFAAFLIGSNTSLPALAAFSVYAAFGILFDLLLQITFFAGIMAIDAKRQRARRLDVLCCVKSAAPVNSGCCCGVCGEGFPKKRPSVVVMEFVARVLSSKIAKGVVIVIWMGLLTVGIIGASKIKVTGDINNFIPDGSYLETYIDMTNLDEGVGSDVGLYFVNNEVRTVDFSDPQIGQQMLDAIALVEADPYTTPNSFDAWYTAFGEFNGSAVPAQATFYAALEEFLASEEGSRFASDIVFVKEGNIAQGIRAHRFTYNWLSFSDTVDEVKALDSARDTTDKIPQPLGDVAFAYGDNFLDVEQYKLIGKEAVMNISLAFVMIAVIVIFLLASPIGSLITFLCVASSIVELIGIMHFLGLGIDSVVVIFLVISLGLAVDYSVHVAHGFLAARDTDMEERLRKTLVDTGAPVINGATSTIIAALFLVASGSYVFQTFFKALLTVVLAGAFQGLIVLPVLMSIFAPAPHVEVNKRENDAVLQTAPASTPVTAPAAVYHV